MKLPVSWKSIDTAPEGEDVTLVVVDAEGETYTLNFPCRLQNGVWVNSVKRTPLKVQPTHWRIYAPKPK